MLSFLVQVAVTMVDPIVIAVSVGLFYGFRAMLNVPAWVSAVFASLISGAAITAFIALIAPDLPSGPGVFFVRSFAALIVCGIVSGTVWWFRAMRKPI